MRGVFKKHAAQIHVDNFSKVVMWGGMGFGLWSYVKNTLLLRFYKRLVELQGENGPVESSVKLTNLVNEVIEDLKDEASEYTDIDPVIVPGANVFSMGTWGTFSGGFIGVPVYFECSTINDVSRKIEIKSKIQGSESTEMKVENEEAYKLFLLSEEAKKYAIAREVLLINNLQVYIDTFLPFTASCIVCGAMNYPAVTQGLMAIPTQTRFLFFTAITFGIVILWRKARSFVTRYHEKDASEEISKLGETYLRGALEYHEKEMQRKAYVVEMKGQNDRILNIVREKLKFFVPKSFPPSQKYLYFKNKLETVSVDTEHI